jgi:hypothetical protein
MTPIRRELHRVSDVLVRECGKSRPIVVGILPGDVLEFRLKGTRRRYLLGIGHAFYHAARLHGEQVKRERAAARRARRGG